MVDNKQPQQLANDQKIKTILSNAQIRSLTNLRIKMSQSPELHNWLQLEILDMQDKMRYTPGISSDYQLGQSIAITNLLRKLELPKGGIDQDEV